MATRGSPKPETVNWHCMLDAKARLGEVPSWSVAANSLYWIDCHSRTLNRTKLDGASRNWTLPSVVGSYALFADQPSALIALESGIVQLDLESETIKPLYSAPYDTNNYRFNDGKCDRAGRFWVGTMRKYRSLEADGGSCYYRVDADSLSAVINGVTVANGTAWSPDGRTMYIADRPNCQILAFDYDHQSGQPSNRRQFVRLREGQIPDGATVDSEGGYWIAMFGAGCILRFSSEGQLDRHLEAPTRYPTMVTFGGEGFSTMFVTTASADPVGSIPERHAGGIFCCDLDVRGLPVDDYRRDPRL